MATAAVRIVAGGTHRVAAIEGDVDIGTCQEIDDALRQVLDDLDDPASAFEQLTLELAEVSFMGSSGLASLLRVQRRVEQAGARLVLASPSRAVRELLAMTHLTAHFDIRDGTTGS